MDFEIIQHEHDEAEGVYRVVVGQVSTSSQTMVDEQGQPLYADYEDVEVTIGANDEGEPIVETRRVGVGEPMTEQVRRVAGFEDFVFADSDERWEDKDDEQIVDSQLRSIKRVLSSRVEEAERQAQAQAKRRELPGVGRKL